MENGWIWVVVGLLVAVMVGGFAVNAKNNPPAPEPQVSVDTIDPVRSGTIKIGMTQREVVDLIGRPNKINLSVVGDVRHEQWVYRAHSRTYYIYFEDYHVTAMQN